MSGRRRIRFVQSGNDEISQSDVADEENRLALLLPAQRNDGAKCFAVHSGNLYGDVAEQKIFAQYAAGDYRRYDVDD